MIIDTHTHFYDPTRPQGVPWPPPDNALLYRRVMPEHFRAVASPCGVTGTVVVEASAWVEDNQWLLDLAANEPMILGVIGRLDPTTLEFAAHLERFSVNPLFRGIRLNADQLAQLLADSRLAEVLAALAQRDLTLDVGGGLAALELALVRRIADMQPTLRLVLNHTAKAPRDPGGVDGDWRDMLRAHAGLPRVYWKLSGFAESALKHHDPVPSDPGFYRGMLDAMLDELGPDHLLYASNWPVCERGVRYDMLFAVVKDWLDRLDNAVGRRIVRDNALAAYGPLRIEGLTSPDARDVAPASSDTGPPTTETRDEAD